jgi:hypothetical protein
VDSELLLHLLPVAVMLAGWVLFVVLVYKFREDTVSHPSYRARKNAQIAMFSEDINPTDPYNQKDGEMMSDCPTPTVTIRVSGKLFEGHLPYLNQLVQSAADCRLWAVLDLAMLAETDSAAVQFLARGEDREFGIASCPSFVRDRIAHERIGDAAA